MKPPSKRFEEGSWSDKLVPVVLAVLLFLLVVTILVAILSMTGLFTG